MQEDGFTLADATVTVIGLGLMGGSLALALKGKCRAIWGVDLDPATCDLAITRKVVDRVESDPEKALPGTDLLVLAAPVPAILEVLDCLPDLMPDACLVIDLGSSKARIVEAMRRLPERFQPLGGHPICGREQLSLEHADGSLFRDAPFVLAPVREPDSRARQAAGQMLAAIGAREVWMEATDHDRILAFTSHLPFLLSSALALTVPADARQLVGPGFRSAGRLAGTPASMMSGVLETNRENVLSAIRALREELDRFEKCLVSGDHTALVSRLGEARDHYLNLVH